MIKLTKRGLVRFISFFLAALLTLGASTIMNYTEAKNAKRQLNYGYLKSVNELALSLDNIKNTLNKGLYSNNPNMLISLSSELFNHANDAKVYISSLPMNETDLTKTYKFLSQVGNYATSLSKKFSTDEGISDEDKANIKALHEYSKSISADLWKLESEISAGNMSFLSLKKQNNGSVGVVELVDASGGFRDIEDGLKDYPTLIYDGPFSDHLMVKESEMLKAFDNISAEEALEVAKRKTGKEELEYYNEMEGNMPSYLFKNHHATISITKAGGLFSYMLNFRKVEKNMMTVEKCIELARTFLQNLGMEELIDTYHETGSNVCIVNFAGLTKNADGSDVILYTDLVKVGIAMDNGEILSYDATGYINNHIERSLGTPTLSEKEASQNLSGYLTSINTNLCVIPSTALEEKYCYEFHCINNEGQQILVYINTETGEEEEILILEINEHGKLTV